MTQPLAACVLTLYPAGRGRAGDCRFTLSANYKVFILGMPGLHEAVPTGPQAAIHRLSLTQCSQSIVASASAPASAFSSASIASFVPLRVVRGHHLGPLRLHPSRGFEWGRLGRQRLVTADEVEDGLPLGGVAKGGRRQREGS